MGIIVVSGWNNLTTPSYKIRVLLNIELCQPPSRPTSAIHICLFYRIPSNSLSHLCDKAASITDLYNKVLPNLTCVFITNQYTKPLNIKATLVS